MLPLPLRPADETSLLGELHMCIDGPAKVKGAAVYSCDVGFPTYVTRHLCLGLYQKAASSISVSWLRLAWEGARLTVYEQTRYSAAVQQGLTAQLGMNPADKRVVTGPIGCHFGPKIARSHQTSLVAPAAERHGGPVLLDPTRRQCFMIATHRPETRHVVRLGANRNGRFVARRHYARMAPRALTPSR